MSRKLVAGLLALTSLDAVNALAPRPLAERGETVIRRHWEKAPLQSWGNDPVRGVNLGGWLVLEPWITPSLFKQPKPVWVVDESTYGKYMLSQPDGDQEIQNHWNTWITKDDFAQIAEVGLNTVRIPVGFWSLIPLLNGETFMVGALDHLKNGVRWAREVGLQVMLDLHGAPGGQNTWDNSGMRGFRHFYESTGNMNRTLDALQTLMREFNIAEWSGTVTSICIRNEPNPDKGKPEQLEFLKVFYQAAYRLIRDQSPATPSGGGIVVIISEAYQNLDYWKGYLPAPKYQRAALDWHVYHMFEPRTLDMTLDQHIGEYCSVKSKVKHSNDNLWTIVGEFTVAPTDCGAWKDGGGSGAQWYDGRVPGEKLANPNNCESISRKPETWTPEYRAYLTKSWETQSYIYEQASGWVYWCWKTEEAKDWSLKDGIEGGWITPPGKPTLGKPCAGGSLESHLARGLAERTATVDSGIAGLALAFGGAALMAF